MKDLSQINLIIGSIDFLIDREIDLVVNKVKQKQKEIEKKHLIATNEDAFSQLIDYLSPNLFGNQSIVIIDEINVAEDKLDEKLVQFIKIFQIHMRLLQILFHFHWFCHKKHWMKFDKHKWMM